MAASRICPQCSARMIAQDEDEVCEVCRSARPFFPSSPGPLHPPPEPASATHATARDDGSVPAPPLPGLSFPEVIPAMPVVPQSSYHAGLLLHRGRYKLVRRLGKGGMGEVWLAEDLTLDRRVAVKLLPITARSDLMAMENLRRETARGQSLTHPNIIRVHDLHEDADCAMLAMEFVDGLSLAELRRQQPDLVFTWDWLAPVIGQLCAVLAYAHTQNIIHRDLKPANLMLDSGHRLKLADFGIAATLSETWNHATQHLPKAGTLSYMSPQQLDGLLPRPTDDVYALGAMLYHLLTGALPLPATNTAHHVKQTTPKPINERLRELHRTNFVPAAVETTIQQCLAKRAEDRPQSATELARRLGLPAGPTEPTGNPSVSPLADAGTRFREWMRRSFVPLFELPQHRQRGVAATGAAFLVAVAGVMLLHPRLGETIANWSFDLTTLALPRMVPVEVVITYLDDKSHKALDQPGDAQWDRRYHAQLIDRLTQAGARAVVFDVLFDTAHTAGPAGDAALEQAISRGNVVLCSLPSSVHQSGQGGVDSVIKPLERFRAVAKGLGTAGLFADSDLTIRQHPPALGDSVPLSVAALAAAGRSAGPDLNSPARVRWLRYYGPPGTIPHVSFHKALAPDGTAPDYFRDKVVFVGGGEEAGFSGSRKDSYRNPYSQFSPGVEVHATAFLNLLRRDWLVRLVQPVETWAVVLVGLLAGYVLIMLRPVAGLLVASLSWLAILGVWVLAAHEANVWFAWLVLCVEVGVAFLASVIFNTVRSRQETRLLERALAVHLPARRVKEILKNPTHLQPGTEKREVSLLFSQIADFPLLADRTTPEKLYPRLNAYFSTLIAAIHEADGTLIKLTGDGAFALWNAPEPQASHQEMACRAALAIQQQLQGAKGGRSDFPFRTRIGIHFGTVAVGNFGSAERMDYTAAGSSVNLASALAQLNRQLGTSILASELVSEAVGETFSFRALGWFRLPGFQQSVPVCEVLGLPTDPVPRQWVPVFEEALGRFRDRDFVAAARLFEQVSSQRPGGDVPSQLYLKAIAEFRHQPPPDGWVGEMTITAA